MDERKIYDVNIDANVGASVEVDMTGIDPSDKDAVLAAISEAMQNLSSSDFDIAIERDARVAIGDADNVCCSTDFVSDAAELGLPNVYYCS